jgi:hypothetical protein
MMNLSRHQRLSCLKVFPDIHVTETGNGTPEEMRTPATPAVVRQNSFSYLLLVGKLLEFCSKESYSFDLKFHTK